MFWEDAVFGFESLLSLPMLLFETIGLLKRRNPFFLTLGFNSFEGIPCFLGLIIRFFRLSILFLIKEIDWLTQLPQIELIPTTGCDVRQHLYDEASSGDLRRKAARPDL